MPAVPATAAVLRRRSPGASSPHRRSRYRDCQRRLPQQEAAGRAGREGERDRAAERERERERERETGRRESRQRERERERESGRRMSRGKAPSPGEPERAGSKAKLRRLVGQRTATRHRERPRSCPVVTPPKQDIAGSPARQLARCPTVRRTPRDEARGMPAPVRRLMASTCTDVVDRWRFLCPAAVAPADPGTHWTVVPHAPTYAGARAVGLAERTS